MAGRLIRGKIIKKRQKEKGKKLVDRADVFDGRKTSEKYARGAVFA